ncbi:MAG: FAD binding domain-containing protein [Deltaproteobacteria bacterium]|nr:FAD binding domain-containing protein [Deltaproteobacteria bacterium]
MTHGYVRPASLAEALSAVAEGVREGLKVTPLCGGTDWMVERHLAPNPYKSPEGAVDALPPPPLPPPDVVVDLSAVDELRKVELEVGEGGRTWVRLGAGVTYRTLREHPYLVEKFPILAAMASEVGAVQIQALGTLGGNIATGSPAADGVPVLVALGARVRLQSLEGAREMPLEDYYTGYRRSVRHDDELLESVVFPELEAGSRWFWRKVGTRRAQSISKVALASVVTLDGGVVTAARLAMASVAPTVACLRGVRAALLGQRPEAVPEGALLTALRGDIAPIGDVRSTREYRLHVAERVLLRMREALGD